MSVCIESVHVERSGARPPRRGSRELAIDAATKCVSKAALGADQHLPLLIYAGVHRDGYMVEPAQAPFVQRALGDSAITDGVSRFCLSFDVDRLFAAIEVASGLMHTQRLERAMVVASDSAVPSNGIDGASVEAAAGAVLLAPGPAGAGFRAFRTDTYPEHGELYDARLAWRETSAPDGGATGEHVMLVAQRPRYLEACATSAQASVLALLHDLGQDHLGDDVLVIPSQTPPELPSILRDRLGLRKQGIVDLSCMSDGLHTAGPLVAVAQAMHDGRWDAARSVLFVAVTSGIVVSTAWYENVTAVGQRS